MSPDLQGELGSLDPGVVRLLETLTTEAAPAELAGEPDALTMFRTNHGARPQAVIATPRPTRPPVRWRFRLVGAAAVALVGGTAAAAYAAVLPAPVQTFAYHELGFLGVPPVHHTRNTPAPGTSPQSGGHRGHGQAAPGRSSHHRPSGSATRSPASAGNDSLSLAASDSNIVSGTTTTLVAKLSASGHGVQGATVKLFERRPGQAHWHLAATAKTGSAGNATIPVSPLVINTAFRVTGPRGADSSVVKVTVSPPVTIVLRPGAKGLRDVLVVSTKYARPGNTVVLQVQSANGTWVSRKVRLLNAAGRVRFVLSGRRLQNDLIRVRLVATRRHAASVSNSVTVPPPT